MGSSKMVSAAVIYILYQNYSHWFDSSSTNVSCHPCCFESTNHQFLHTPDEFGIYQDFYWRGKRLRFKRAHDIVS